jgi:hypothetical protein
MIAFSNRVLKFAKEERKNESLNSLSIIFILKFKFTGQTLSIYTTIQLPWHVHVVEAVNNIWL